MPQNSDQTTLRMSSSLRNRVAAQASAHGRTLAAEIRAACELALCQRTLWVLRHDRDTRVRLGGEAGERERQALDALERLCSQLFGSHSPIEGLLEMEGPTNDERSASPPSVRGEAADRVRPP
jgi:predicted DNA-binding protein